MKSVGRGAKTESLPIDSRHAGGIMRSITKVSLKIWLLKQERQFLTGSGDGWPLTWALLQLSGDQRTLQWALRCSRVSEPISNAQHHLRFGTQTS